MCMESVWDWSPRQMDLLLDLLPLYTLSFNCLLVFIIKNIINEHQNTLTAYITSNIEWLSPLIIYSSAFELNNGMITVILDSVLVWLSSMLTSYCQPSLLLSLPCWAAAMSEFSMAATLSGLTNLILDTAQFVSVTSLACLGGQDLSQNGLPILLLLSMLVYKLYCCFSYCYTCFQQSLLAPCIFQN